MVLHVGCNVFVPLSSVVAVLDAAGCSLEPDAGSYQRVGPGPFKSIVVTACGGRCVFFLSPISAKTLCTRAERGV